MPTCCACSFFDGLGDAEPIFLHGTGLVLTVAVPAAIGLASWKLYAARKRLGRPTLSVLGLSEAVDPVIESKPRRLRIAPLALLIYLTSAVLAFDLGYLSLALRQLFFD